MTPDELKAGIDELVQRAWNLALLERSITSGHATDADIREYQRISQALFGRVRADRAADPAAVLRLIDRSPGQPATASRGPG